MFRFRSKVSQIFLGELFWGSSPLSRLYKILKVFVPTPDSRHKDLLPLFLNSFLSRLPSFSLLLIPERNYGKEKGKGKEISDYKKRLEVSYLKCSHSNTGFYSTFLQKYLKSEKKQAGCFIVRLLF